MKEADLTIGLFFWAKENSFNLLVDDWSNR